MKELIKEEKTYKTKENPEEKHRGVNLFSKMINFFRPNHDKK
jgi:hypothetical protein